MDVDALPLAIVTVVMVVAALLEVAVLVVALVADCHDIAGGGEAGALAWQRAGGLGNGEQPVSYTHLTLPTNREV